MHYFFSWRNFAYLLTVADLWRVRIYDRGVWFVLIVDGIALVLICFAEEIDDLTFGQWFQGAPSEIDIHTPPFLIAFFGWVMLVLNTAMLFFTGWLKFAGQN
jgi:hypothetical protein